MTPAGTLSESGCAMDDCRYLIIAGIALFVYLRPPPRRRFPRRLESPGESSSGHLQRQPRGATAGKTPRKIAKE